MQRALFGMVLPLLACGPANAALQSRAAGRSAPTDDTDSGLTWVADANLAQTSGYDADGAMDWGAALGWICSPNSQNDGLGYLGKNDWRLLTVEPLNGSAFNYTRSYDGSTDYGFNQTEQGTAYAGSTSSEIAHLFHNTLDNKGGCDALLSTAETCADAPARLGTDQNGSLFNVQFYYYWYGTEYAPNTSSAWNFYIFGGEQEFYLKSYEFYAWAVRTGDIGNVPHDDTDTLGRQTPLITAATSPTRPGCDSGR